MRFESAVITVGPSAGQPAVFVAANAADQPATLVNIPTDALGRSSVNVALGPAAGSAPLRITVPDLGLIDSALFTVTHGHATRITAFPGDTIVPPNATYQLSINALDRFDNPVPISAIPITPLQPGVTVSSTGVVKVGPALTRVVMEFGSFPFFAFSSVSVIPPLPLIGVTFVSGNPIYETDLAQTSPNKIGDLTENGQFPHTVSATNKVVFQKGILDQGGQIWIVERGGAASALVTSANGLAGAAWPRFSTDGAWVYFVGVRSNGGTRTVFRIHPDGSGLDSLTTVTYTTFIGLTYNFPAPSPDGRTLAVGDASGLKLVDLATGATRTLSQFCDIPTYSPDGSRIACYVGSTIVVFNADGSNVHSIGGAADRGNSFDWSPDGEWIITQSANTPPIIRNASDGRIIMMTNLSGFRQLSFLK